MFHDIPHYIPILVPLQPHDSPMAFILMRTEVQLTRSLRIPGLLPWQEHSCSEGRRFSAKFPTKKERVGFGFI